mgnify:CR=1 FL=1
MQTSGTTLRIFSEELVANNNKVVVIDYTYAIENGLLESTNKKKAVSVLCEYGVEVRKMLFSGQTYTISADKTRRGSRKLVRVMIKQVCKNNGYYGRVGTLISVVDKYMMKPTLKIDFETQGSVLNKRKIGIMPIENMRKRLLKFPVKERYKFSKA